MSDKLNRVSSDAAEESPRPGAIDRYDLHRSRIGGRVFPGQSRNVLAAGLTFVMLACTAEQAPTEGPGSASLAQADARAYAAVDLGTLSGSRAFAFAAAINSAGQVAGASTTAAGETHAFLWDRGVMIDLGTLGGDYSQGLGINERGQVVGVTKTAEGAAHAFLWEKGVMSDLGTVGERSSGAVDINARGQIVGGADGIPLMWEKGVIVSLPLPLGGTHCGVQAINAAGRGVGQCTVGNDVRAVLWDRDRVSDLGTLGGSLATATGINAPGAVVGISRLTFDNGSRPFLWERGTMTDLSTQGAPQGFIPVAINAGGQIAGHYGAGGQIHAAVWQRGTTIDLSVAGIDSHASDINASGQVVGYTVGGDGYHAVLWTRK